MDLISALAVGAGALVVGGIVLAIEALEDENRQKQLELDLARSRLDRENSLRAVNLERLSKLNDAHVTLQEYKRILDAEAESERAAYDNWKVAKAHMKHLKEQRQCVVCETKKIKSLLDAYVRAKSGRNVDLSKDANVCNARKKLRILRKFQMSVEERVRAYVQVKKEVWNAMQLCNKQKQEAVRQFYEIKQKKRYFECVSCGRRFAVTVGQLADFYMKGFQPPKRCPECRQQRKLMG